MSIIINKAINSLKVAVSAKVGSCILRYNKHVLRFTKILQDLGYINGFCILDSKLLKVNLKYVENKSALRQIYVISRPSSRVYLSYKAVKRASLNNNSTTNSFIICHTSKGGLLTDLECALLRSGGEPYVFVS